MESSLTPEPRKFEAIVARDLPDQLSYKGKPKTRDDHYQITLDQGRVLASLLAGKPVLTEHAPGVKVGQVLASEIRDRTMYATFELNSDKDQDAAVLATYIDMSAARDVSLGHYRGSMKPFELTVCNRGARAGSHITGKFMDLPKEHLITQDGKQVAINLDDIKQALVKASAATSPVLDHYIGSDIVIANLGAELGPPREETNMAATPNIISTTDVGNNSMTVIRPGEERPKATIEPVTIMSDSMQRTAAGVEQAMAKHQEQQQQQQQAESKREEGPMDTSPSEQKIETPIDFAKSYIKSDNPVLRDAAFMVATTDKKYHDTQVANDELTEKNKGLLAELEQLKAEQKRQKELQGQQTMGLPSATRLLDAMKTNADMGHINPKSHETVKKLTESGVVGQIGARSAEKLRQEQAERRRKEEMVYSYLKDMERATSNNPKPTTLFTRQQQSSPVATVSASANSYTGNDNGGASDDNDDDEDKRYEVKEYDEDGTVRASISGTPMTRNADHCASHYHPGIMLGSREYWDDGEEREEVTASFGSHFNPGQYVTSLVRDGSNALVSGIGEADVNERPYSSKPLIPKHGIDHNYASGYGPSKQRMRVYASSSSSAPNEEKVNYDGFSIDGQIVVACRSAFGVVRYANRPPGTISRATMDLLGCKDRNFRAPVGSYAKRSTDTFKGDIPKKSAAAGPAESWPNQLMHQRYNGFEFNKS